MCNNISSLPMSRITCSIYLTGAHLPEGSPLRCMMEKQQCGGYISPTYRSDADEEGSLPFGDWAQMLVSMREALQAARGVCLNIGIMPDTILAEFTLILPAEVVQLFADAGINLQLTLMPSLKSPVRYNGTNHCILAADSAPNGVPDMLPSSIARRLWRLGLHIHHSRDNLHNLYSVPLPMAPCIALCKFVARCGWITLDVPAVFISQISRQQSELLLHIDLPMPKGAKIQACLCPTLNRT